MLYRIVGDVAYVDSIFHEYRIIKVRCTDFANYNSFIVAPIIRDTVMAGQIQNMAG